MLDRTIAPHAHALQISSLPEPKWIKLSNGIPICLVKSGSQEVIEIQLVLHAGYSYDDFPGAFAMTARLLTEGTQNYIAKDLAEKLDYYGAFFQTDIGYEQSSLTISTLAKHTKAASELFAEIILRPTFPEIEIEQWRDRMLQRFTVEEQKTKYQATRLIKQQILGKNHPYSFSLDREAVSNISKDRLLQTWQKTMQTGMGYLMVAGNFDEDTVVKCLEDLLGGCEFFKARTKSKSEGKILEGNKGLFNHQMPDTMQSTIRCGSPAVSFQHEDKYKLSVLGTIFGGFFGSRLMKNIREDKGYTYGIFGDFIMMKNAGYLLIGTDVANEFVQLTLNEIKNEMELLKTELVSEQDLSVAKNYMLGHLISKIETPFQIAEQIKTYRLYDVPLSEYVNQFDIIQNMTAEEILSTAKKYFNTNELSVVVAGTTFENQS